MPAGASRTPVARDPEAAARELLERLPDLPGGPQLLELGGEREDVELIGGATRDLLLGRRPRELDVVVAAGADELAQQLAQALGGEGEASGTAEGAHERFGTAYISWAGGRIDIATRRAESYPAPGALPEVRAGSLDEDLLRRDFTVNAIAIGLGGAQRGRLRAPPRALEDLEAEQLRVLHEQSFRDDPTRLMRLARYGARLSFTPEPRTAELAAEALSAGALQTVSGARIGSELRLALREPDPLKALLALARLGVLGGLDPPLAFAPEPARGALAALPDDGRQDLLLLACLLLSLGDGEGRERRMGELLGQLEFPAADRDRAVATALLAPKLAGRLAGARSPSLIRAAVGAAPIEAVALAAAIDMDALASARRWLSELRHVALRISGDDLIAAGVPEGPEIGRRLRATLDMRLEGALDDSREAQLRAALEAP